MNGMQAHTRSSTFRTHIRLALAVVCGSALLLACGAGRGTPAPAPSRAIVRIATSGDYPPFSHWPEAAPEPEGFAPDLLRAWTSSTGRRIEWVRFRWPDLIAATGRGDFDLAAGGITVRADRSIGGTFGIPLATSGAVALALDAGAWTLDALDRKGVSIAVNHGGHLERVTRKRFPRATVLPTTPNEAVPLRLAAREADAVVSDTREAPLWRADHPDWIVLGPFTRDRKAVLAAPGREALLAELDAWLLGAVGRRTLDVLRLQHLGDDPRSAHVTPLDGLLSAMDDRLALMPDVARYKHTRGLAIEVPEREARVLEASWLQVRQAAATANRPAPAKSDVEAFFRAQIEAAKEIQRRVIEMAADTTPGATPDLDAELRPALMRIGARITWLLVELSRDAGTLDLHSRMETALASSDLSDESMQAIGEALARLVRNQSKRTDEQTAGRQ